MESEPSPREASSDEISKEKLMDGEVISHVKETEKSAAAEANLDVECRSTNAVVHTDSAVLPIRNVQEGDKSHQEPEFSISSEERATVHSESEKQQDCTSSPELSQEPTENKEHVRAEETDFEAKKDQVHESNGTHGEALDTSAVPGSISEIEGSVEEPISAYASAEPVPKETGDVSQDEHIMVKSSSLEVDVDTGLLHPPTDVNLVKTTEKNKEPETKITDVEEPVVEKVNEENFATEIVEVTTKVENAIESLESDKVEDQTKEIKNENSLETINPVKATSAIEIAQSRDMEAMVTDEMQKISLEAEGVMNLAIEAATRMPEIPAFVIPTQSIGGSTLEIGPTEETEEKEIEDKTDAVMEAQNQFHSESTKHEDDSDGVRKEVDKDVPNESSYATSAIISTEETCEVEAIVAKQFPDDSINDASSVGVDEKIKELEDEFAEDAQEEATEIKRKLQTDFIVATSAIMNAEVTAEVGVKVEDEKQEGLTKVGKQFPRDSSSATSTVDVEETREVDATFEKQFADDSTNATSAIRVDEETKDQEVELADDTQEEATEVKRELQTNSGDDSAIITGEELGAKIDDEEQEALTKVGKEFPNNSSCATLVVETEETREPDIKFAHIKQEMEVEVDKEAPLEFTNATSIALTAEGTTDTEATAADDKQEVATEVEKQCPIGSCSATPAIVTDEEARQSEAKLADGIQEVAIEVEKLVSAESVDVHSVIITANKAKDVEDKIEDDKQEEYINVEQQIPSESSNAVSAITTNEETRKQEGNLEGNNQEAATELEKEVPTEPTAANSTIVPAEEDREVGSLSGTEVETPIPSESGTATLAIGPDEETRELEVKFSDDKNKVATTVEKQISTDSNGVAPAIVVPQFPEELDGKAEDDKQEVAEEAEEPVPSNSGSSILATGTANEIRGPEAELADENQEANGAEMQVPTEFSGATSAFSVVEETTEIEDNKQGAETQVETQVPSDSITSFTAARTYEGTREPEVPIADDKQEEVTEDEKMVPAVLSGMDTIIIEETRELEAIIEEEKQAEKEVENHVLSESSKDNSAIVKTEKIRERETKLDDDKQDAVIVGVEQTHGDSSTATLVATDEQEALVEVKNEVPTDSCGSNSAIATSKELTETEVSIMDGYQAAKEVDKQVPSDSITASSAIGTNEETSELDVKLAGDAKEVEAVAKHVPTESVGHSSFIVSAENNSETEAQTEDDKKAAGRKLEQVPETDEETKRLEVKLKDCKQPIDFEEVPTDSSGVALAIATAMETKELEAKIEDDSSEEAEKQVQSESTSAISVIGTVEEERELQGKVADGKEEGKTVDEKHVLIQENIAGATSEIAQVFIDKQKDILLVEMVDGKDNSLDNLEIHRDIENQVKEDAIDISVPEPPTYPKAQETSNGTSVILCGDETRQSKVEALNEKQDIPVEIKELSAVEANKIGSNSANVSPGAAKETTETESKVAECNQEAEVDIVQQVPSDSIVETSAIENEGETRKLGAEILEDKLREATVVDKQVVNRTNEIDASSEIVEVSIKEENDIVIVEMVDGGHLETTKLAKEDASYIGMPEVVTNVRANQSPIAIPVIPTSDDELTQPKVEVIDEMQERSLEIEPSVTEINRSHSSSVSAEVPLEETSHVGNENIADKKGEILDVNTSAETSGDINVAAKIFEISFEGVKGPKDDEMVRKNNECLQIIETEKNSENSKVDTIIIVESCKNLDNGTQIDDASLEGNRSLEGGETVKDEQKEINIDSPGITEISTELVKSPDVVKEIEETNGGNIESGSPYLSMTSKAYDIGCGVAEVRKICIEISENESKNLQSKTMALYETTKLDDESAEISNILSEENKVSEGPEVVQDDTKEEKDYKASVTRESVGSYIETSKDLDVKEVIATATSGVTELLDVDKSKGSCEEEIEKPKDENLVLAPKSADVNKEEESPKQETSAKSSPRRSNNIISKVKHSIVKAKKAVMGKSQAPKDASPRIKEIK